MVSRKAKLAKISPQILVLTRENIRRHGGTYVALMDGEIVASGKEVFREAEQLRKSNPRKEVIITYVPTEDLLIL